METRPPDIGRIELNLQRAIDLEHEAESRLSEARIQRQFWNDLELHIKDHRPAAALLVLEAFEGSANGMHSLEPAELEVIERLKADLSDTVKTSLRQFDRLFPEAAESAGIQIDDWSRHPRYTVKQGFIQIEIDERSHLATITPRDGKSIELGVDVPLIIERLRSEIERLFERQVDREKFLRTLFNAYAAVIRTDDARQDEDEVALRRVMNRLDKNLKKSLSADEFNVDLSHVVKSGHLTVDERRMLLNHTRIPRQGMLLHELEEGGYQGFISFKKEQTE